MKSWKKKAYREILIFGKLRQWWSISFRALPTSDAIDAAYSIGMYFGEEILTKLAEEFAADQNQAQQIYLVVSSIFIWEFALS